MNTVINPNTGIGQTEILNAGAAKFEITGTGTVQVAPDLIASGSEVTLRSISGPGEDAFVRADGQSFFSGETECTVGRGPVMITAIDLIATNLY